MAYQALPGKDGRKPTAVVTGGSSGIGLATARLLIESGYDVIIGARDMTKLENAAKELGAKSHHLDVTDAESISEFVSQLSDLNLLVNNAGGAFAVGPIAEANIERWRLTFETNVLGLIAMTRACLPLLEASGQGHVVNMSSVSGFEIFPNGGAYTGAKHAVHSASRTLRVECRNIPVRVTEILAGTAATPGMLAKAPGLEPLDAADVADAVAWAVTRPVHVDVDEIVIRPVTQLPQRPGGWVMAMGL
jgi:NADP-dependent 3-hydroxy acid dehydrogenase YdfG